MSTLDKHISQAIANLNSIESAIDEKGVDVSKDTLASESAFERCYSLNDVYYEGTPEQFSQISIEHSNEALTSATIHYNYNSD